MGTLEHLKAGLRLLALELSPGQERQFTLYRELLLEGNQRANLTAITDPQEVETLHFLDSLTVALAMPRPVPSGYTIADIGAGAGFPGLPLKIALPQIELALVEATVKKTAFLRHVVERLGLTGVTVLTGRAEEMARRPELREAFEMATARAVAELRTLMELALPFCKVGGRAVLLKKGALDDEVGAAATALQEMGGRLAQIQPVPSEVLGGSRALVVVEKVSPTPDRYPRRSGVPARRPM
ncbi:MAG: 16S rRNA (guanine(527)-N(7))-methyltransferase RsmG [Chloroflexi bacterium]|nr:16S rRNA (guanine(527)-N(7))-methyltransferase RsmG [Chloroflexota bacterium]